MVGDSRACEWMMMRDGGVGGKQEHGRGAEKR